MIITNVQLDVSDSHYVGQVLSVTFEDVRYQGKIVKIEDNLMDIEVKGLSESLIKEKLFKEHRSVSFSMEGVVEDEVLIKNWHDTLRK